MKSLERGVGSADQGAAAVFDGLIVDFLIGCGLVCLLALSRERSVEDMLRR